jgi:uncharacterized protein YjlB
VSIEDAITRAFPSLDQITDARLQTLVGDVWRYVFGRNPKWTDIDRIPLHPTMPIAKHGNLVTHITGMARLSEVLVPMYRELWQQDLDVDLFRAASYIHDAAKVIEFVEHDGSIIAAPGFNHAIEAGRIARELGGPEGLAHMVEAHSFAGPLVMPRTRNAQLFLVLDVVCLNVFPEDGSGAVERHLNANGWTDPRVLERYRSP